MILPPDLAKKALEGRVSMACFRRISPKCIFRVDHAYALQAGKSTIQRVTVREVREAMVSELDLRDAKRLGFRTRTDFFERWKGANEVWLVRFELGDNSDTPRLLAKRCGGHGGDYVSSPSQALPETAEEVSSAHQRRFAAEGVANLALAHSMPRERLLAAVEEILPTARNAKDRKRLRSIEHQARQYQT